MKKIKIIQEFTSPSIAYRGKPFWSWNGELDRDELIHQSHILGEMGFGGYFMHSRSGLITEYLGDEWFDLINSTADAGEKEGLEVTDEDLDAEFENLSKIYNQPAENVKNMFTQRGQVGLVKRNILMEKVAAFLLENAKIG